MPLKTVKMETLKPGEGFRYMNSAASAFNTVISVEDQEGRGIVVSYLDENKQPGVNSKTDGVFVYKIVEPKVAKTDKKE